MWQGASSFVLALSPFFFEVRLVIRKLLVLVTEVQWGCAGWEKLLCPAYWSGSMKREVLSCPGGEGGYQMFLYQNLLQSTVLFSLLSPKFEKSVVWSGKKVLEGKIWMCGEQMWGWMLPPDL